MSTSPLRRFLLVRVIWFSQVRKSRQVCGQSDVRKVSNTVTVGVRVLHFVRAHRLAADHELVHQRSTKRTRQIQPHYCYK